MVDSVRGGTVWPAAPLLSAKPAKPIVHRHAALYWSLFSLAVASMLFLALLSFGVDILETGPLAAIAAVAAVLPVPVYIGLFLWLDRFEPEPTHLLIGAFAWGAGVAGFFACLLNTLVNVSLGQVAGQDMAQNLTVSLSAPLMEETLKGFALLILFFWRRADFDDVIDGIIYAGITALGFATVENISYYGRGLAQGGGVFAVTLVLRGILSPYAHVLFTSMTGIGFGLAAQTTKPAVKFMAPVIGWICAMLLHFLWNTVPMAGGIYFILAYLFFWIPVFFGVVTVIFYSLYRESKLIRLYLLTGGPENPITPSDAQAASRLMTRLIGNLPVLFSGGWKAWNDLRHYQHAAVALAFYRYRVARGRVLANPALEAYYLGEVQAYRPRPT